MRLSRIAIAVLLVLLSTSVLAQEKTGAKNIKAVRFGKLWDGKGKVLTNAIVVIDGGKFAQSPPMLPLFRWRGNH